MGLMCTTRPPSLRACVLQPAGVSVCLCVCACVCVYEHVSVYVSSVNFWNQWSGQMAERLGSRAINQKVAGSILGRDK